MRFHKRSMCPRRKWRALAGLRTRLPAETDDHPCRKGVESKSRLDVGAVRCICRELAFERHES
jgi:hypothetical protein